MDRHLSGVIAYRPPVDPSTELLPNPSFVFPMAAPDTDPSSTEGAPSNRLSPTLQHPSASRRRGAHGQRKSINALPAFSFNPSATSSTLSPSTLSPSTLSPSTLSPSTLSPSTPPLSPHPASPTTPRNMGHRRGGSEFIGGDTRSGSTSMLSSSPTKLETKMPPPPVPSSTLLPGPPPGRRGHAHRRSAAISSHDLSSILQPADANTSIRGNSAPTSPLEVEPGSSWPRHTANKSLSYPSLRYPSAEENVLVLDPPESPKRPPSRARVGFSDRVEYIRPLSTISSETESSMSTIRGHSVSNSLSSVISAGAPSPPSARLATMLLNASMDGNSPRPKTAGAVLDKPGKAREGFNLDLFGRQRPVTAFGLPSPGSPSPLPSPAYRPRGEKKKGFFHLNHHKRARPSVDMLTSQSEPTLVPATESPPASPVKDYFQDAVPETSEGQRSSKDKPKRARKVKSWTNPFGSKKPKSPLSHPVDLMPEVATLESSSIPASVEELSLDDLSANFDVDNTVTIVTPTTEAVPPPQLRTDFASWQPKHLSAPESETRSPIIDLDLALGPFDTSERARGNSRDFASARRTMHSSGFAAGVFPGSTNHRRTESAPALVPFELRKAASTSAMADVFEEDEEEATMEQAPTATIASSISSTKDGSSLVDDPIIESEEDEEEEEDDSDGDDSSSNASDEDESSVGIQVVESDMTEGSPMTWDFLDNGLGIRRADEVKPASEDGKDTLSPVSAKSKLSERPAPFEVVEDFEEPRTSSLTHSSDSTITADGALKELQTPMSLAVPLPKQTLMTPDTIHSAAFSSPELRYSKNSFEGSRLGTATSSITDNRTINSLFGEPGPEVRVSTDDVPSLTSSRSTMTGGLQFGGFPLSNPRRPGERTSSISSACSTRSEQRTKRTSIASLSRLMGGGFGERSKLHIEQRPQSEHRDLDMMTTSKTKKPKRLSKLMQFWRSSSSK